MSHDTHSLMLGKLTIAVCLKAAKFGIPKHLDPKRVLRWIQHPEALERRMQGLLSFLEGDPDEEAHPETKVEVCTLSPGKYRTVARFLSELEQSEIVSDRTFDKKVFAGITDDNKANLQLRLLTAVCFNKETTANDAEEYLAATLGCEPAPIEVLAQAGMQMPGFIRHLGLVAAPGTKFGTNGSTVIPFLFDQQSPSALRLDYGHHGLPWPPGTWFLGISPLSTRASA